MDVLTHGEYVDVHWRAANARLLPRFVCHPGGHAAHIWREHLSLLPAADESHAADVADSALSFRSRLHEATKTNCKGLLL